MGQKVRSEQIGDGEVKSNNLDVSYVYEDGNSYTTFDITSTSAQNTGMSITLPTPGTWLVTACVRTRANTTAGGAYIRVWLRLNDTTDMAEIISGYDAIRAAHMIMNDPMQTVVTTTTANETVDIWAARSSTAFTYAKIESDTNGYTTMTAVRIA